MVSSFSALSVFSLTITLQLKNEVVEGFYALECLSFEEGGEVLRPVILG